VYFARSSSPRATYENLTQNGTCDVFFLKLKTWWDEIGTLIIIDLVSKRRTIFHIGITAKSGRKFTNNVVTIPKHKVYIVTKKALS